MQIRGGDCNRDKTISQPLKMTDIRDEFTSDGNLDQQPIEKRAGGCAAVVGNKLYVWGGQTEDVEDDEDEPDEPPLRITRDLPRYSDRNNPFEIFHFDSRTWTRQSTVGKIPNNGLGSMLEYDEEREQLYLFGGWKDGHFDSEIYVVSLKDFCWNILQPSTDCKPSPRYNVASILHKNKLHIFGGVGVDTKWNGKKEDPWADDWVRAPRSPINIPYGWNNEYFHFDLVEKCWTAPLRQCDIRPPPLGAHRMARIDEERAAMFGGKGEYGCTNDLWVLNLDQNIWTGPLEAQLYPDQPWPIPCRFFSFTSLQPACCSVGCWKQQILLLWGKANYEEESEEVCHRSAWILEFNKDVPKWTELSVNEKPRSWHVAGVHPTRSEVVITGGNKHYRGHTGPRLPISDTCTFMLGVMSLQNLCLSVILELIAARNAAADVDTLLDQLNLSHNVKKLLLDHSKLPFDSVPRFVPELKH